MNKEEIISDLKDFNKHAKELFDLKFVKEAEKSGITIRGGKDKPVEIDFRGPDDEQIKAFANDIRKFIQPNDSLCINKLQAVYKSKYVGKKEKKLYGESMSGFGKFNKDITICAENGKKITNLELLNVFLYGKFSHRSKATKDVYDRWEKNPLWYYSLKLDFVRILYVYLKFISNIVYANNQVLKRLGE